MRYDFKCTNKKCNKHDKVVEISCSYEDLTKNIQCGNCKQEMSRVWSVPSIKPSGDRYKG